MENERSLFDLTVDSTGKAHLLDTAKWARFLAIVGFIGLGLLILFSIISLVTAPAKDDFTASTAYDTGVVAGTIIGFLLVAALYFFPCLFLFRFANKMKTAIDANDVTALNEAFKNLKITLRYLGVLTIIFIVLFFLGLVSGL